MNVTFRTIREKKWIGQNQAKAKDILYVSYKDKSAATRL